MCNRSIFSLSCVSPATVRSELHLEGRRIKDKRESVRDATNSSRLSLTRNSSLTWLPKESKWTPDQQQEPEERLFFQFEVLDSNFHLLIINNITICFERARCGFSSETPANETIMSPWYESSTSISMDAFSTEMSRHQIYIEVSLTFQDVWNLYARAWKLRLAGELGYSKIQHRYQF